MKNFKRRIGIVPLVAIALMSGVPAIAMQATIACSGFREVNEGGLTGGSQYKVHGAKLVIYRTAANLFSAELSVPNGQQSVSARSFPDLVRGETDKEWEEKAASPKLVTYTYPDYVEEGFHFRAVKARAHTFTSWVSAQMPGIGWSTFEFKCTGKL